MAPSYSPIMKVNWANICDTCGSTEQIIGENGELTDEWTYVCEVPHCLGEMCSLHADACEFCDQLLCPTCTRLHNTDACQLIHAVSSPESSESSESPRFYIGS
jgi:hypothetical protein